MAETDEEFASVESLMEALYRSISGPPGGQDWALSRRLYHPCVRLVRTRLGADGKPVALSMSGEEYEANAKTLLADTPFYEVETERRVVRFGNVAQVFSAYEARSAPAGGEILKRGMNLAHLYHDGARWWLMHLLWDDERPGVTVPAEIFRDWKDVGV
ncbi:MAG: hypothetical protein JOZ90_01710 [Alphaproteobacteria bacterium]|nr:hypothetical protein [Alphaproteobacteria bacterium]MBV9370720.1 hypothetical protein [Alphaproteobacteria bacterium]MBV9899793.1 hypothetical protein [Alphaproteobacteria bacterium]